MAETQKEHKVPWFVHEEADKTTRLIGGLALFLIAMAMTFYLEMKATGTQKFLTPALLHSIFAFIAGWVGGSGAAGGANALKKLMNGNGGVRP